MFDAPQNVGATSKFEKRLFLSESHFDSCLCKPDEDRTYTRKVKRQGSQLLLILSGRRDHKAHSLCYTKSCQSDPGDGFNAAVLPNAEKLHQSVGGLQTRLVLVHGTSEATPFSWICTLDKVQTKQA
jgi:hypothetical protein